MTRQRVTFQYETKHKIGCAYIPNNVKSDTIVDVMIVLKGKLTKVQELFGLLKTARI